MCEIWVRNANERLVNGFLIIHLKKYIQFIKPINFKLVQRKLTLRLRSVTVFEYQLLEK